MIGGRDLTRAAVAFSIVLSFIAAGGSYLLLSSIDPNDTVDIDASVLVQSLSSYARSVLVSRGGSSVEDTESSIKSEIEGFITSSDLLVPGYTLSSESIEVDVIEVMLPLGAVIPTANSLSRTGTVVPNSQLSGSSGYAPLLPVTRALVEIDISATPIDGGERSFRTISFSVDVIHPEKALDILTSVIEADMTGWGSGIARDVEYMLNVLARVRTTRGIGVGTGDTNLNVLNEGDVELAVNIAIGLRIAKWTGSIPEGLLSSIDRYFTDAEPGVMMNPTGERYWGSAEIGNYNDYLYRSSYQSQRRTAVSVLDAATMTGHSDTADLFARLLYLDRMGLQSVMFDPLDGTGALYELRLLNPRQSLERIDPYSLEHHPAYAAEGLQGPPSERTLGNGTEAPGMHFYVDLPDDYLVVGKDLNVKGLNDPRAWFTNVNLALTEADLENKATRSANGTRCGFVPPPPQPPYHDFRAQWDLTITGSFDISASVSGWLGSSNGNSTIDSNIGLSFPARVYTWWNQKPSLESFEFINLNTGLQYYTPVSTGWVITSQANATEHFEKNAYQALRPGLHALTSLLRSATWWESMPFMGATDIRKDLELQAMATNSYLKGWAADKDISSDLGTLWNDYIKGMDILPDELGRIRADGLEMTLSYSFGKDRMDIEAFMPEGSVTLSVSHISGGVALLDCEVLTPGGIRVVLEPKEDGFLVIGDVGGSSISDGPSDPEPPSESVSSLVLSDNWVISSPSIHLSSKTPLTPFLTTGPEEVGKVESTYMSFVLSGIDRTSIMGHIEEISHLPHMADPDIRSLMLSVAEISSYALANDLWWGISAMVTGENGSAQFCREVWIGIEGTDDLSLAFRTGSLRSLVENSMSSGHPNMEGALTGLKAEVIVIETSPAWTVPYGGVQGMTDMVFVTHMTATGAGTIGSVLNVFYIDGPERDIYGKGGSTWQSRGMDPYGALW